MKPNFKCWRIRLREMLSCLALGLCLMVGPARADDFDTLIYRWAAFFTGGTNLDTADPNIASRITSAVNTANSYWNSMVKTNGRTCLWTDAASTSNSGDVSTCYNRLSAMAVGWAMTGSSLYHNATLGTDILSGLDWMYANRYNETVSEYGNWYDWEIGAPLALNQTMVLMYSQLAGAAITNYCNAIDHFTPAVTMTGANRTWKAEVVGVRGAVQRNASKVSAARDGLSSLFIYATSGDGFYQDGGFIQHGKIPYTAGYGNDCFNGVAQLISWLSPTAFAVTDPQSTNVIQWCYNAYEPFIYYGALPDHLMGRYISRGQDNGYTCGHSALNTILRLAQTAPASDAARLNSMVKYWAQVEPTSSLPSFVDIDLVASAEQLLTNNAVLPRGELVKSLLFPSIDRSVHLRPGFGFSLSMFSSRVCDYESINYENLHGWYTGSGMTYLWTTNDLKQFFDSYWPTVDPYHLPGTTTVQTPLANSYQQSVTSSQAWVGGAVLSNAIMTVGMSLADVTSTLVGRKSWFMFDNEIVCLGAGITCSSPTNVQTTIENRNLHTSYTNAFTVNGVTMPTTLGWSSNLNNVSWCALASSGGYYFPGGANLLAARSARTGAWSDIKAGASTTPITRNYFSLIADHGVSPANASYAYVLLPNYSAAATAAYASNPPVMILTNTANLQAVRKLGSQITAANFWVGGLTADFITAQNPAAVVVSETNNELLIAVSDPTWLNNSNLTLTLNRAVGSIISVDTNIVVQQLSPQLKLSVNVRGALGRSFQGKFALASNTVLPANLALQYDFDETSGPALDSSGALPEADATLSNQAQRVAGGPGGSGYALDLTAGGANNNYAAASLLASNKLSNLNQVTLVAWVNLQANQAISDRILDNLTPTAGVGLLFNNATATNAGLSFLANSTTAWANASQGINLSNQWVMLAVTYDATLSASNVWFYSGDLTRSVGPLGLAQTYNQGAIKNSTNAFRIGSTPATTIDRTPPAWLDGVRIYNAILQASDLEALRKEDLLNATAGVVSSNPPAPCLITNRLNGNAVMLSWPAGQGWRLVATTNSLSIGLNPAANSWQTVTGASDGSYSVAPDRNQPAVFYRLINP